MQISYIIPHKNSTRLLSRLLESIPLIPESEVIVVDDNSSEDERAVLKEMSSIRGFSLYNNEGKFAGGARNTGLKYAVGAWIVFADSDDYFTDNSKELIMHYLSTNYDVVFFNAISRYSDSGDSAYRAEHINMLLHKVLSNGNTDILRCCYTVPWGKMIKSSVIRNNNIKFDEVIAGNDMMFSVKSGLRASNVTFNTSALYCVTVTFGSITTTLSKERFDSRFRVTLNVNNYLRKYGYGKYQISVLYFIAKSHQFGLRYMFDVIVACIRNKSNFFVGISKVWNYKKVLTDRQNIKK